MTSHGIDQVRPWLDDPPANWRVVPLGHLVDLMGGATPSKDEPAFWNGTIPWVSPKDMKRDVIGDSIDHVSAAALDSSPLRLIPERSVLTVVRGMILAHTVPVAITSAPVTLNQDMKAMLAREGFAPEFLAWALRAFQNALLALVEEAGHGTKKLRTDLFKKFMLLVPPASEQRAIADFLDRKTAAIDALIEKKERLIALLEEKRQALITQAVTKGLDPSVPIKDSGIEWLGEIPAHWELKRLKHLRRGALQYGANASSAENNPSCPRFIRITDIDGAEALREDTRLSLPWAEARPYLLEPNDVLLARSGATVGKSFIYRASHGPACFAGYLIRVRFNQALMRPGFFWRFSTSNPYLEQVRLAQIQATIQNVGAQRYAEFIVPTPPPEEQRLIELELRAVLEPLARLGDALARSIDRLREYRQAAITAAVTGRLDVTSEEAA